MNDTGGGSNNTGGDGNTGGSSNASTTNITTTIGGTSLKNPTTPIYVVTIVAALVFFIGPLVVRKSSNKVVIRCCIMLSSFCMWIFWLCVYISQMNPLLGPRLHNTTLAWMGHSWGNDPKLFTVDTVADDNETTGGGFGNGSYHGFNATNGTLRSGGDGRGFEYEIF